MRPEHSASSEPALQPGIVLLAEYLIEREIERGDDWALYLASHVARAGERFRVRVLRHDTTPHPDAINALVSRASRLARLAHPGIAPIVTSGVDRDRGVAVIVTRDRIGISLRDRLARRARKLTSFEIARVICEVGDALDYLHAQHPPIALGALDSSRVFLAAPDGSVRLLGLDEPVVASTAIIADQFALASIAYECLTGNAPFPNEATLADVSSAPRLDLTGDLASKSADLDWVLQRAWASDETRRFSSAGRLAAEIARLLGDSNAMTLAHARRTAVSVEPPRLPSSGTRPATRLPALPTASAATARPAPRMPTLAPNAPHTPPSGERPAILPNAGRYTFQPEPLTRRTSPRVASAEVPSGERRAIVPTAGRYSFQPEQSSRETAQIDALDAPAVQSAPTRRGPPPLPSSSVPTAPERPPARTPTIIGVAVAPPPLPALVAEIEPESTERITPDIEFIPSVDPPEPSPVAEVAPPPAPPEPIAPIASAPTVPLSIEPDATQLAHSSDELARPAAPIPLVTMPLNRPAKTVAPAPRRHSRRIIQLVGACVLALAFGGAERLAPHVRRVAPDVWRWTAQWFARPSDALQSSPTEGTTPIPANAPTPRATPAEPIQASDNPVVTAAVILQRPDATDRIRAANALHEVINECAVRVERAHRHARFAVAYEGRTGAAVNVTFSDVFFRTHPLGACIADGARHVSVRAFTDRQWVGTYSILVP